MPSLALLRYAKHYARSVNVGTGTIIDNARRLRVNDQRDRFLSVCHLTNDVRDFESNTSLRIDALCFFENDSIASTFRLNADRTVRSSERFLREITNYKIPNLEHPRRCLRYAIEFAGLSYKALLV